MKKIILLITVLLSSVTVFAQEVSDSVVKFDYAQLDSAVAAAPNRIDYRHRLFQAAVHNNDAEKIAETYLKLLDYGLNHNHIWVNGDSTLMGDEGREMEADVSYDALIDLYSLDYADVGEYSRKFVDIFPHDMRGYIIEGVILLDRGEYEAALRDFEAAEVIDPDDPYVLINSARVYTVLGRKDDAVKRCQLLIASDRANDDLKENATMLLNYLDAKKKEMTPYYFAHQWLSVMAPQIPIEDGEILATPKMLNTMLAAQDGLVSPFADEDISVEIFKVDDRTVYVWRLPEPKKLRESLYVVFVPEDGHFMAYAISIGQAVDWELSTSNDWSRSTYGRVKRPESAADCVEVMKDCGVFDGKIIPGEFIQEGYQCPEP